MEVAKCTTTTTPSPVKDQTLSRTNNGGIKSTFRKEGSSGYIVLPLPRHLKSTVTIKTRIVLIVVTRNWLVWWRTLHCRNSGRRISKAGTKSDAVTLHLWYLDAATLCGLVLMCWNNATEGIIGGSLGRNWIKVTRDFEGPVLFTKWSMVF